MGTELNAKPHYLILDGLRGIAAILVVFLQCSFADERAEPDPEKQYPGDMG